jgi:dsRNA-specific ribonuclease
MATTKFYVRENPANKYVTKKDIESIMMDHSLPIRVNDLSIYQKAFVHRSYTGTSDAAAAAMPLQPECNETYEFLGDTILSSVIGTYLYTRYYDQNEGFLTKTRTKLVRTNTLGELAKRLNFGKFAVISQHVEMEGGRDNMRILEDIFEAFIAAIYIDNGGEPITEEWGIYLEQYNETAAKLAAMEKQDVPDKDAYIMECKRLRFLSGKLFQNRNNGYLYCQRFIMTIYERYINIVKLISHDDNYKDRLQHYYQQAHGVFPTWELIREEGKTNNRWHTIGVHDRYGKLIGVGKERKKIDAEQLASKNALIYLGVIPQDQVATDEVYLK